jgi:hypothetical protein
MWCIGVLADGFIQYLNYPGLQAGDGDSRRNQGLEPETMAFN